MPSGRKSGYWITVMVTEDEFRTLRLMLNACLEAGGDPEQLVPLAIRIKEAKERFEAKQSTNGDNG